MQHGSNRPAPPSATTKRVAFETADDPPDLFELRMGETFTVARERQCNMLAAYPVRPTRRIPWPLPSKEAIQAFGQRHPAWKTSTQSYQITQQRMLFLYDVPAALRLERFDEECFRRLLAPTTALSYWVSWQTAQRSSGTLLTASATDNQIMKVLKARAQMYPVKFPKPITKDQVHAIVRRFEFELPSLTTTLELAFGLGQRFGDAIQIAVNDILFERDQISITVVRGKVMKSISPYSIFVPNTSPLAPKIRAAVDRARAKGWLFVLSPRNHEEDREQIKSIMGTMLASEDEQLELRSIRRGSLQLMAAAGFPTEHILLLSQHRSTEMLMRYLDWGRQSADHSSKIVSISSFMTAP